MGLTSTNPITGAQLVTKAATPAYQEGHERIFGKSPFELKMEAKRKQEQEANLKVEDDSRKV